MMMTMMTMMTTIMTMKMAMMMKMILGLSRVSTKLFLPKTVNVPRTRIHDFRIVIWHSLVILALFEYILILFTHFVRKVLNVKVCVCESLRPQNIASANGQAKGRLTLPKWMIFQKSSNPFWPFWGYQKWHFGCPNQKSKTTFIDRSLMGQDY